MNADRPDAPPPNAVLRRRVLVALDAGAAAAILQALPVTHVQRATNALGALDAPGHEELAEAVRSFFEDLEMAPEGGYRDAHEAA